MAMTLVFSILQEMNFKDLVLSGHTHGGQVHSLDDGHLLFRQDMGKSIGQGL